MHIQIVFAFVVLQCSLCLNIQVPVNWNDDSEVNTSEQLPNSIKNDNVKPTPNEYFVYPAKKPQFVINIAAANGVQSPENNYKSHPIRPHTGLVKPQLGEHRIQHPQRIVNQGFVQSFGGLNYVRPASTSFEIHHPYKSEEPALQQLYKDPVLDKIRNDLHHTNQKLQKYQNEVGESDVRKEEYLEKPEIIDQKKVPHKNIPTQFEVHRPQRLPVYYTYPVKQNNREQILNQKLKDPWNQNIAKISPFHYRPVKNHLHGLRQQHALKYDDERNEYPQLLPQEKDEEKSDGYDIYEKGKLKFDQIRNNLDNTINKVVQEKRPYSGKKPEPFIEKEDENDASSNEEEFVPVKNYAQVRKTEVTKHLPREAALEDAETIEEILNAPRLREAIKSKKAQTVYSEEGYEDSAYDHAGEQKHASDHESHGGYLKQNEISKGKYKTPSVNISHGSKKRSKNGNQIIHAEKWEDDKKENEEENETDYYESEEEDSDIIDSTEKSISNISDRNKRHIDHIIKDTNKDNITKLNTDSNNNNVQDKIQFESLPAITKQSSTKTDDSSKMKKYPYYFQNLTLLSNNSPIRYAENFKFIPKKSNGGTEFYDSRSELECPEVEDNVDPIPDKIKKGGHPDDNENISNDEAKDETKFKTLKNKQRLKGLGDKIDCFKAKYFGENPLDNPFFEEDIIENPEPVTKPSIEVFNTKYQDNSELYNVLSKFRNNDNNSTIHSNKSQDSVEYNSKLLSLTTNTDDKSLIHVRKPRATPFTYEPYKIIRDSQVPDSKKTTTSSNISPLIKKLQSSRVIDKVTTNQDKDQGVKKISTKVYKNIGKGDRQEYRNEYSNDSSSPSFVDVNADQRRGEPRYEIRPANHKSQYSPVENKRAISVADYTEQIAKTSDVINSSNIESTTQPQLKRSKRRKPTSRPFFDVSQYLPKTIDTQQIAASNTVRRIIRTTTSEPITERAKRKRNRQSINNGKKYDDAQEEKIKIASSTTTIIPVIRKKTRRTTTTPNPIEFKDEPEAPKLELVTRFREYQPEEKTLEHYDATDKPSDKIYDNEHNERTPPKYTEKKKKSTKSTLVTDTKSYGEGDEGDIRKEEVDELIGVKHDMEEYIPLYERVVNKINRMKKEDLDKKRDHIYDSDVNIYDDDTSDDKYRFNIDDEDDDDEEDDDDDDEDDDDDADDDSDENNDSDDDNDKEEGEVEKEKDETKRDENIKQTYVEVTTSEPTKRTLARTTEAPATTTESRSAKLELKPIISKKKIEIHKETPVNKSSPHVTQFKQDIKEIEIIKELAPKIKKKGNKNIEALDLYRDDKLAEEVNKLGDVEVFRENLDLKTGPKHGGNYRSITPEELEKEMSFLSPREIKNKGDVETSQTETRKSIDFNDDVPSRGRGYHTRRSPQKSNREKSAQYVELSDTYDSKLPSLHGGNLKLPRSRDQSRYSRNEKYVEIDEDDDQDEPTSMHGGNFNSYGNSRNTGRKMHGGNYKSAKIVKADDKEEKQTRTRGKTRGVKADGATSLSGYVRSVPELTTTPPYILDPSKRQYYFVDV